MIRRSRERLTIPSLVRTQLSVALQRMTAASAISCLMIAVAHAAPPRAGALQPQISKPAELQPAAQPDVHIPAVIERPLNIDEGDKIKVVRFEIKGAADHPEDGLYLDEMQSALDQYVKEHPDGLTVGRLQEAANIVRDQYRTAGFPIAQAFVPVQDVHDGVVEVKVLEGVLGTVTVEKNVHYSEELIKQGASDIVGEPVRITTLEGALLTINDYPGLDMFGVLRPGKRVGEADLVLTAQNEDPFQFFATTDNHGVDSSGQTRLFAGATANNLLGLADQLDVIALQTIDPRDSLYGGVNYEFQTPLPSLRLGAGYNTNAYHVSDAYTALPVTGDTTQSTFYAENSWLRSRKLSLSSKFALDLKKATVENKATHADINRDELTVLSASLDVSFIDDTFHGVNQLSTVYSRGVPDMLGAMDTDGGSAGLFSDRQDGTGKYAGGDFEKLYVDYSRVQPLPFDSQLLLRINGQHSKDILTSLEQFSLGGPNSVRAYPVGDYLFDQGWFVSGEWSFNAPFFADKDAFAGKKWGDLFRVFTFIDYAGGKNQNLTAQERTSGNGTVELAGMGAGAELRLPNAFFVRAEAAAPLGHYDASDSHNPQYWLSAGVEF